MEDSDLLKYIYIEYSISVIIVTELARLFLKKIKTKATQYLAVEEPKWLTLVVAALLSVADYIFISKGDSFNFYQSLISFGCATLGYDYVIKLIKDTFKRGINETPTPPPAG
jgi:hypothetical protein